MNWPTLEGRLANPLTTDEEALTQLKNTGQIPLIELTKHLKELRMNQPKVTLKEAQEQAKRCMEAQKESRRRKRDSYGNPQPPDGK